MRTIKTLWKHTLSAKLWVKPWEHSICENSIHLAGCIEGDRVCVICVVNARCYSNLWKDKLKADEVKCRTRQGIEPVCHFKSGQWKNKYNYRHEVVGICDQWHL